MAITTVSILLSVVAVLVALYSIKDTPEPEPEKLNPRLEKIEKDLIAVGSLYNKLETLLLTKFAVLEEGTAPRVEGNVDELSELLESVGIHGEILIDDEEGAYILQVIHNQSKQEVNLLLGFSYSEALEKIQTIITGKLI